MHIIETLDKLLKDELSATETYKQTLDILREDAELGDAVYLMPIYEDHEDHKVAVSSLQTQIRQLGGTPAEDSGAWGTWAKIVMGGR
jgi:bacterioferritin (cytochrome b1)